MSVIAVGVYTIVNILKPTTMDKPNTIIDQQFSSVQQDVIRFIRHCAQRNGATQDYVRVSMQSALDNQIINP